MSLTMRIGLDLDGLLVYRFLAPSPDEAPV